MPNPTTNDNFDCIRYSEEPEKLYELVTTDPAYRELDEETYDVIAEYTGTAELMEVKQFKQEGRTVDMCAITELIQRGRMDGITQGITQGIEQGIKVLILDNIEEGTSEQRIIEKLQKRFELDEGQAKEYWKKYGN